MRIGHPIAVKIWSLALIPFAVQIALVGVLAGLLNQVDIDRKAEIRARDREDTLNAIFRLLATTARDVGDARATETADTPWTSLANNTRKRIHTRASELQFYRRDDPTVQAMFDELSSTYDTFHEHRVEMGSLIKQGEFARAFKLVPLLKAEMAEMLNGLNRLMTEQAEIETTKQQEQELDRSRIEWILVAGVILNILLAASFAVVLNTRIASRLRDLMNNTERLVRSESLSSPLGGDDEIAKLDRAFRRMAQSVAATNRRELAVVANAADIICCLDSKGNLTVANPALTQISGRELPELLGQPLSQIMERQDAERISSILRDARDQSEITFEGRIRNKDDSRSEIQWSGKWSPQDETLYCIGHDVTKRNELERLKHGLLAMVSHDLRTPMTSLKMFLSLASNPAYGQLRPEEEELVAVAEDHVDQLNALVENVLDMEAIESRKLALTRKPVNIMTIIETALQSVSSMADRRSIDVHIAADVDTTLSVDPDRLVRAVTILLSCAINLSEPHTSVELETAIVHEAVKISITNQSKPLPVRLSEEIFDRYSAAVEFAASHDPTARIGLAICKAIVEQHGGKVGIEPSERGGNRFWLMVPSAPVEEDLIAW